jgi:hypothetical protein
VYESVDEMQKDLENYFHLYNMKRPHQGRNMNGRTPYKAFTDGLKNLNPEPKNNKTKKAA